jgi:hypothetical protein
VTINGGSRFIVAAVTLGDSGTVRSASESSGILA